MGSTYVIEESSLYTLLKNCHHCLSGTSSLSFKKNNNGILNIYFCCCDSSVDAAGLNLVKENIKTGIQENSDNLEEVNNASPSLIDLDDFYPIEDVLIKKEDNTSEVVKGDDNINDPLELEQPKKNESTEEKNVRKLTYFVDENGEKAQASSILDWINLGVVNIKEKELKGKKKYPDSFACEFCGKIYIGKDRAYNFARHLNSYHIKQILYKCPVCSKTYWGERELLVHVKIHSENAHICEICGKLFQSKKSWSIHSLTHSAKQFDCSICNKKFRRKDHLQVHLRLHSGSKPYRCTECNAAYPQNSQLKLHLKHCKKKLNKNSAAC